MEIATVLDKTQGTNFVASLDGNEIFLCQKARCNKKIVMNEDGKFMALQ